MRERNERGRLRTGIRPALAVASILATWPWLASAAEDGTDLYPPATESWALPDAHLYGVDVVGSDAWAVGYWGTVLRSSDRGATWERVPTPTDANLYDVSFSDSRNGWVVGAEGIVMRSSDGGRSWRRMRVDVVDEFGDAGPLEGRLFGVAATSANEAWAVGDFGVVLHTRGGDDWRQVTISEESFADENIRERIFNSVRFTDRERGIIAGEFGTLLRTENGGEIWTGERLLEGAIDDVYLFDVAPNGRGVALSSGVGGVTIRSGDGGLAWSATESGTTAGLFGAAMSGTRGLLVGDRGVLLHSTDAGSTWREPERPRFFNWLRGVAMEGDDLALAVGEDGVVIRSLDGGASWEWRRGHQPAPETGISVPDPAARAISDHELAPPSGATTD